MKNALTLTEKETFFIRENRQDMNSKHCGQTFTLKKLPVQSRLKLSKPIV